MEIKLNFSKKTNFAFYISFEKETFFKPTTTKQPNSFAVYCKNEKELKDTFDLCALNYFCCDQLPRRNYEKLSEVLKSTINNYLSELYDLRFDLDMLRTAFNCGYVLRKAEAKPLTEDEKDMFRATITDIELLSKHKQAILDNIAYL